MADPQQPALDQMSGTIARAVNTIIEQDFAGYSHGEKMRLLAIALARECGLTIATITANEDLEQAVMVDLAGRAAVEVGRFARTSRQPNTPMIFDFREHMRARP